MAEAAFNKNNIFASKFACLKFQERTSKELNLEHNLCGAENLDTSESKSEIPGEFFFYICDAGEGWRRSFGQIV